jgi:hypothetical protein
MPKRAPESCWNEARRSRGFICKRRSHRRSPYVACDRGRFYWECSMEFLANGLDGTAASRHGNRYVNVFVFRAGDNETRSRRLRARIIVVLANSGPTE